MRAHARAPSEVNDGFDIEQALEMLRAGDASSGLRDLRAFVDANPGNRAARQRIGNAVADRARELEDQGAREQAVDALRAGGRAARRRQRAVGRRA